MWPFGKSAKDRLIEALEDQKLTGPLDLGIEVKNKTAIVTGSVPNERYKGLIEAVGGGISGLDHVDVSGVKVDAAATGAAGAAAAGAAGAGTAVAGAAGVGAGVGGGARTTAGAGGGNGMTAGADPADDPSARAKAAYQKIKAEASLANNPLDVLQKGHTVVLRGAVDSQVEFEKAKSLAMSVDGVTGVDTAGLQIIEHASELNVTDSDGDIVYTVKSGDTLSAIALKYYGSAGRDSYMKIAEANGIADANKIQVGQALKIPGTTKGPEAVLG